VLWRFLALRRLHRDGAAALAADTAALKAKNWPYAVIEFNLGRETAAQMRQAASDVGQQCDAAFYEGEWDLLKSKKTKAESEFRTAAAVCPKRFVEYDAAARS
jgi:rhomboid protease GluP